MAVRRLLAKTKPVVASSPSAQYPSIVSRRRRQPHAMGLFLFLVPGQGQCCDRRAGQFPPAVADDAHAACARTSPGRWPVSNKTFSAVLATRPASSNAEPEYSGFRYRTRPARGSWCGLRSTSLQGLDGDVLLFHRPGEDRRHGSECLAGDDRRRNLAHHGLDVAAADGARLQFPPARQSMASHQGSSLRP